jgi:glutamate formiminotransferase
VLTKTLLAAPNVSEGRDTAAVRAIGEAFASRGARLLDSHSDPDHNRSVFTLAAPPGGLADALLEGAREALARIDLRAEGAGGVHPYVGAVDVLPVIHLDARTRGAACAEALVVGDRLGDELGVPVFLYGALGGGRTRAEVRRGGAKGLAARIAAGTCAPDFGPVHMHERAGATLVAAREPLVAFNLALAPPADAADARRIAGLVREGGAEGLRGVRAIGVELRAGGGVVAQVSLNVENPLEVPLARVVEVVGRHARPARAELVGLAPRAALEGFPEELPMPGFDPGRHVIENVLGAAQQNARDAAQRNARGAAPENALGGSASD